MADDPKSSKFKDLGLRSVVAVFGGALVIWVVYGSEFYFYALFGILTTLGFYEAVSINALRNLRRKEDSDLFERGQLAMPIIALCITPFLAIIPKTLSVISSLSVLLGLKYKRFIFWVYPFQVLAGFAAAVWLRVVFSMDHLMMLLIATWSSDIGAYLVGVNFGKTPLAPTISPKKTWEGTVGGLVMSILAASAFGWSIDQPLLGFVFGTICGAIGPMGDLSESRLKRAAGVKDSAGYIPGHGGVLDRFDAFIVNAPFCFLAAYWFAF
ncbi:MAG: phosphatidate cytidylyltransferase [Candidatus Lindowbacteria bacterium]|nr:phosphatidate cytidylyltransferase [Candidatus Lindowbacteria bacterium]